MKVYFYDVDSGVYQGEGFETVLSVLDEGGVTAFAPPAFAKGFVPFFDRREELWTLQRNGFGDRPASHVAPICRSVRPPE